MLKHSVKYLRVDQVKVNVSHHYLPASVHSHSAHAPSESLKSGTDLKLILALKQELLELTVVQWGKLNFQALNTANIDLLRRLLIDDPSVVVRMKHALAYALAVDDERIELPVWFDAGLVIERRLWLRTLELLRLDCLFRHLLLRWLLLLML